MFRGVLFVCAVVLLTACNGLFDEIYDKPTDNVSVGLPYGYRAIDADSCGGTIFVDATSYTRWTYFDLVELTSDTIDFSLTTTADELEAMEQALFGVPSEEGGDKATGNGRGWTLALHRSVPKTNGCEVARTRFASVGELSRACELAGGVQMLIDDERLTFCPDEWGNEQVALDLSDMFNGNVRYLPSMYNPVLNTWLEIDISNPPPTYTMSRRAYILRLATGEHYALCMTNFRNAQNLTAWLTIDFRLLP